MIYFDKKNKKRDEFLSLPVVEELHIGYAVKSLPGQGQTVWRLRQTFCFTFYVEQRNVALS